VAISTASHEEIMKLFLRFTLLTSPIPRLLSFFEAMKINEVFFFDGSNILTDYFMEYFGFFGSDIFVFIKFFLPTRIPTVLEQDPISSDLVMMGLYFRERLHRFQHRFPLVLSRKYQYNKSELQPYVDCL
jgi:hypothetical protein